MNEKEDKTNIDSMPLKPAEAESMKTPGRQTPHLMSTSDPYLGSATQDSKSKFRKSQHTTSMEWVSF